MHSREPGQSSGVYSGSFPIPHSDMNLSFGFRLSESSLSKTKTVKDMDLQAQQPLWFLKELIASKSPGL